MDVQVSRERKDARNDRPFGTCVLLYLPHPWGSPLRASVALLSLGSAVPFCSLQNGHMGSRANARTHVRVERHKDTNKKSPTLTGWGLFI